MRQPRLLLKLPGRPPDQVIFPLGQFRPVAGEADTLPGQGDGQGIGQGQGLHHGHQFMVTVRAATHHPEIEINLGGAAHLQRFPGGPLNQPTSLTYAIRKS